MMKIVLECVFTTKKWCPKSEFQKIEKSKEYDTPYWPLYTKSTTYRIDHISKTESWTNKLLNIKFIFSAMRIFPKNLATSEQIFIYVLKKREDIYLCEPDSDAIYQWG